MGYTLEIGKEQMLLSFVKKGVITVETAAEELGKSSEEIEEMIKNM